MSAMFWVLYILLGLLLATPYCFLAGWSLAHLGIIAIMAPAFLLLWWMAAGGAGIVDVGGRYGRTIYIDWKAAFKFDARWRLPGALFMFWGLAILFVMPILWHGSALLLIRIGYVDLGSFIEQYRYMSPLFLLLICVALTIPYAMFMSVRDVAKGKSTGVLRF